MAHVACLFSGIIPRDLPCLGPGLWLSSPSREETGFAFTCRTILVQSLHMLTPSSFCTVAQHSQTPLHPTCWGISGQKLPITSHPWVRHDPLRPFSRGSMLFHPFQSAQCHLLASCLFPLCCRIARLHREGHSCSLDNCSSCLSKQEPLVEHPHCSIPRPTDVRSF